ncbi:uncharacterized protein METZ01_LOCUS235324, partial [marine metagenome]
VSREFDTNTVEDTIPGVLRRGQKILTATFILFRESFISSGGGVHKPQPAK